jgi:hypothetical protein
MNLALLSTVVLRQLDYKQRLPYRTHCSFAKGVAIHDLITEKDEYQPICHHVDTYSFYECGTYILLLSPEKDKPAQEGNEEKVIA